MPRGHYFRPLPSMVRKASTRSCSVQYTSVPLGPSLSPTGEGPAVAEFFKSQKSRGLVRYLPSCRFTKKTMRRFHWISQVSGGVHCFIRPRSISDDVLLRVRGIRALLLPRLPQPALNDRGPCLFEAKRRMVCVCSIALSLFTSFRFAVIS